MVAALAEAFFPYVLRNLLVTPFALGKMHSPVLRFPRIVHIAFARKSLSCLEHKSH
jgi:hypothetical protein